jgi:hypothetical protein
MELRLLDILYILLFVFILFLKDYMSQKGKNLATKEDVKDITEKVESVKMLLNQNFHVFKLQFEKEFQIYEELWSTIYELTYRTNSLRPIMDLKDPKQEEKEIKNKRLAEWGNAFNDVIKTFQHNKPFYSADIYNKVVEITNISNKESIQYKIFDPHENYTKYWGNSTKNAEEIINKSEEACELIRLRISRLNVVN